MASDQPLGARHLSWLRTFRGYAEDEAELAARAADEIERLRGVLRYIAEHYDAETTATVPEHPERVGLPGPHAWIELAQFIERELDGSQRD